jgi:hypothetical protein
MNEFKMQEVLDYIEAHPDEYNQASWAGTKHEDGEGDELCGTTCCVAGHAALLNGWHLRITLHSPDEYGWEWIEVDERVDKLDEDGNVVETLHIREAGVRELELTDYQADQLFNGGNDLDEIKAMVKKIANHEAIDEWDDSFIEPLSDDDISEFLG